MVAPLTRRPRGRAFGAGTGSRRAGGPRDGAGRVSGGNGSGAAWLLADMALAVGALAIVKAVGLTYPGPQLVALRAGMGLLILAPWIWRRRAAFRGLRDRRLHALRVALSAVALTAGFHAVARLPLALYAAIGFTRPVVLMAMAALVLGEVVPRRRWLAAAVAFGGAAVATGPPGGAWDPGLLAAGVVVLAAPAPSSRPGGCAPRRRWCSWPSTPRG